MSMRYLTFVFRLIIATTQTSTLLALLGLVGLAQSTLAGEFQVVDKHGTPVPNAIVLMAGISSSTTTEAVIDQVGKRFTPYVSTIAPGTWVRFPNSDNTRYSVYSFSDAKTFELKLYHANDAEPVLFERAGLVALGCNVHDHMKAYILVTDQPTEISDATGQVVLPEETNPQELTIWHPQLNVTEPVAARIRDGQIHLDLSWDSKDPQEAKDRSTLENKFKSFKRNAN